MPAMSEVFFAKMSPASGVGGSGATSYVKGPSVGVSPLAQFAGCQLSGFPAGRCNFTGSQSEGIEGLYGFCRLCQRSCGGVNSLERVLRDLVLKPAFNCPV